MKNRIYLITSLIFLIFLVSCLPNNLRDSSSKIVYFNDCKDREIKILIPSLYNQIYLFSNNFPINMNDSEYHSFPTEILLEVCKDRNLESGNCENKIFEFKIKC